MGWGELVEPCERVELWNVLGDLGLVMLLCIPSTVGAVAVSLTCNGDGVGFRGVLRPSAERGTCAF